MHPLMAMQREMEQDHTRLARLVSPEVTERIRSDNILMRDEARRVCELAKQSNDRELMAHTNSLRRIVDSQTLLVEGVLEVISLDD